MRAGGSSVQGKECTCDWSKDIKSRVTGKKVDERGQTQEAASMC